MQSLTYIAWLLKRNDAAPGKRDPILARLAGCRKGKAENGNVCRNLHRMLAADGWTLPIQISDAPLRIRNLRTRKEEDVVWPVMKLSSWAAFELGKGGEMLLAGCHVEHGASWKAVLGDFWSHFYEKEPGHPVYDAAHGLDVTCVIPYMIHGDEGRGRGKQPLLTISFQGLLSHYGEHRLNTSGKHG